MYIDFAFYYIRIITEILINEENCWNYENILFDSK